MSGLTRPVQDLVHRMVSSHPELHGYIIAVSALLSVRLNLTKPSRAVKIPVLSSPSVRRGPGDRPYRIGAIYVTNTTTRYN